MSSSPGLGADVELALTHLGVDPRDVLADRAQTTVVLELPVATGSAG
jgi:hypothetical protein